MLNSFCFACFSIFCLSGKVIVMSTITTTTERGFECQYCQRVYGSKNGLHYHRTKGSCRGIEGQGQEERPIDLRSLQGKPAAVAQVQVLSPEFPERRSSGQSPRQVLCENSSTTRLLI